MNRSERWAEALTCYEDAVAIWPADSGIRFNRGITLEKLGRYEEACASFERALRIDPANEMGRGWTLCTTACIGIRRWPFPINRGHLARRPSRVSPGTAAATGPATRSSAALPGTSFRVLPGDLGPSILGPSIACAP
ncbi:tetratricopeptide repeat protein [Streptomyces pristinaespiralis]|uniref:tetratricopeptide repeat protein n=1 Tax=Streptomyces pristinaespiralis TaxID=38300 RepID=UPI003403F3B4